MKRIINRQFSKEFKLEVSRRRRESINQMQIAIRKLEAKGDTSILFKTLHQPTYEKDTRLNTWYEPEDKKLPLKLFVPVGYDDDVDSIMKLPKDKRKF